MIEASRVARRGRGRKDRRKAILDAAKRVFRVKGAAQVTVDGVAKMAQVSRATVYLT